MLRLNKINDLKIVVCINSKEFNEGDSIIDDLSNQGGITKGRKYRILGIITKSNIRKYAIVCDNFYVNYFKSDNFITLEESRKLKLNRIS